MTKQNKRKGFSAIEMLVVIAIIAGLVAVVIPVVGDQTTRSKAATNAANLRAIESVVSMKLIEEPDAFEDYFKNGEASNKVDNFVEKGWPQKVVDYFLGEGAAESMIKDYYLQFSDGRTGKTLTIEGTSPQIIISGVALPVAMEAPRRDGGTGLVIGEYDYMSVYICQDGVLAFYNNFTKDDFADVAEDGYYDGAASAGGVENSGGILGEIQKDVCQAQGRHEPGPGCKCRNCGAEAHVDADETKNLLGLSEYNSSTTLHECKCGKVFNAGHVYEGTDHKCKYKKTADEECPEVSPCVDLDPEDDGFLGWGGDEADHKCYLCGGDNNHAWCTTDNRGGGTWGNPLPDHKCDTCGYVMSTCTIKEISNTQHQCTKCEVKSSHNFQNGVCECGAQQKTCKLDDCDRTDVQDDDYCYEHRLKDCTEKMNKRYWGEWQKCSGQYRVSTDDCTNKSNHLICKYPGCGETSGIDSEQYCTAEHYKKDCKETVMKKGFYGTSYSECTGTYRGTSSSECTNAGNHHTHSYTTAVDAVKHKCACGGTENHNYVNGECTECHRKSHIVGTDCLDSNKDHNCDVNGCTNTTMGGVHTTNTNLNNGYHGCSYCTKDRVACSDGDKNHKCDTCGYTMSSCTDGNTDHICDYECGNGSVGGAHTTNKNVTSGANGTHGCTYCTRDRTNCYDNDKNHKCDVCDNQMSSCSHGGYGVGKCNYCGKKNDWWTGCPNC